MHRIPLSRVNQLVLEKHSLIRRREAPELMRVVEEIAGLHATSPVTPYLSLAARLEGFTRSRLDGLLYRSHRLGRIRCVRDTIYIHPVRLLPRYFAASYSQVAGRGEKYLEALGVPVAQFQRDAERILGVLRESPLSTVELRDRIPGIPRLGEIMGLMCDLGILVRAEPGGGWIAKNIRYAVLRDWFPDVDLYAIPPEDAIRDVVDQYLRAFGPASEEDILWWTGFRVREVRSALEALRCRIRELEIEGLPRRYLACTADADRLDSDSAGDEPGVRLLPHLDPYLMGYRHRERYLSRKDTPYVFDRGGNATSVVLERGRVIGVWDFQASPAPTIRMHFFSTPGRRVADAVADEALRTGSFLAGGPVQFRRCPRMIPLTEQSAGTFMIPLKGL